MAIITPADIKARVAASLYAQAFDRNGNGDSAEIEAFALLCCTEIISEFEMIVGAAVPDALSAGVVTEAHVKGQLARGALYKALEVSPLSTSDAKSPWRSQYDQLRKDWNALRKDDGQRLTEGGDRALPHAVLANAATDAGVPTNPFTRARDGRDPSGF